MKEHAHQTTGAVAVEGSPIPTLNLAQIQQRLTREHQIDLAELDKLLADPVRFYLHEAGGTELLTAQEEQYLGYLIGEGLLVSRIETEYGRSGLIPGLEATLSGEYWETVKERLKAPDFQITNPVEFLAKIDYNPADQDSYNILIDHLQQIHHPETNNRTTNNALKDFAFAARLLIKLQDLNLNQQDILVEQIKTDGQAAQKTLTEANLRLVISIAKKYLGPGFTDVRFNSGR